MRHCIWKRHGVFLLPAVALLILFRPLGAAAEEAAQICRYHEHGGVGGGDSDGATTSLPAERTQRYAPDRRVDVLHLKLDVTPNFAARTISGTTTLKFTPISKPLEELRLDAVDLSISDVRSSHDVEEYVATDEDLTISFHPPVPVGDEAWLEIDHAAQPQRGFYFRTPEMGYPESDTHVWTQGQTHEARHWFPCFDYPNERSSTEIICRVPPDMVVLSNGRRVSEELDAATGLKAVRWVQQKPHVSYLICLVAGHLEKLEKRHRDVPLAFYTQPSLIEHAENSFADTADIMAYFEDEIGVPFPWDKYYQVTIRDFTAGGMENTSLTTLTHRTIFAKETENIRSTRGLDAHEMAHQWFGDYLTCKDWSHLWLNEGFATYYAHLYDGHKLGQDMLLYGMYRDAQRILRAVDSRPIVFREYRSPSEQFDYRSYPKGSWVLHMLRNQLGVDLYRRCIQTYLERNALTSVVTEDLNAVIEELSGRSFDPFFDQWVYHGRHPELTVEYRWLPQEDLAHVSVRQTQEVNGDVLLFEFPTKLRFVLDSGATLDRDIDVNQRQHDFYFALPAQPKIVRFDPDYTVLAKVAFSKPTEMLLAQLSANEDMIGRLLAVEAIGKRSTKKSIEALRNTLQSDPFFGVRLAASGALRRLMTDEAFEALQASLDQADARVRQQVVQDIGRYYKPRAMEILCGVAEEEPNPAIVAASIRALGQYQHQRTEKLIRRLLWSQSFRNELAAAAIDAIRSQLEPAYADELQEALAKRRHDFESRDFARGLGTLAELRSESADKSATREFLLQYVDDPQAAVRMGALRALGVLGDRRAAAVLESYSGPDRDDRIASVAKAALEKLQKDSPLAPREVAELRKLVGELKQRQEKLQAELEELRSKQTAQQSRPGAKQSDADGDEPAKELEQEAGGNGEVQTANGNEQSNHRARNRRGRRRRDG